MVDTSTYHYKSHRHGQAVLEKRNKEIAATLNLTDSIVKVAIENIFAKTGSNNRVAVVLKYIGYIE